MQFEPNNLVSLKNSFKSDNFRSFWLRRKPTRKVWAKCMEVHYVDDNNYNRTEHG